jgi:uncharacterized protein
VAEFDWDDGNREKCRRHGVAIADIEAVLGGNPRVAPDVKHTGAEERFIAVGHTRNGRPIFIAFTVRMKEGRRVVRPITARYMHRREISRYEEAEGS